MKKVILYLLVFLLALSACGAQPTGVPDHKILVTVSIPPQAWVVEQIGGDLVSVQAMAGPSDDPHTYEPKPAQMAALAGTELYLTIGIEFEQAWLPRFTASNPKMSVVDSAAGITRMPMASSIQLGVTGTQEGEQGMLDPHVWLSPALLPSRLVGLARSRNESNCPAARDYSRAYLHHLMKSGEYLGSMLLSWANTAFYQQLMAAMRQAIAEDRFEAWSAATLERISRKA